MQLNLAETHPSLAPAATSEQPLVTDKEYLASLYSVILDPSENRSQRLGQAIAESTSAIAVFIYSANHGQPPVTVLHSTIHEIPDNVFSWSVNLANRTLAMGLAQTEESQNQSGPTFRLTAIPVAEVEDTCLLAFHHELDSQQVALKLQAAAAAYLSLQSQGQVARQLASLQALCSRTEHAETREAAAATVADSLAVYLEAEHVAVAVADGEARLRILAVSDQEDFDVQSEQYRLALALLQEAVCRHEVSIWPNETDDRHALLCHRQYAEFLDHAAAIGCPLFDTGGKLRGAILVSSTSHVKSHVIPFLRSTQRPLATTLHLVHRAEQNRIWRRICEWFTGPKSSRRKTALYAAALVCLLLCVPMRYRIKATCRLEPSQKRFLAAPFDGKLSRCLVEPGDHVTQGQLLAELDGQEIQWELGSVQAELQRAKKERAGYVAAHESGKARLSQHEIEYLESKVQLLTDRISQLDVQSPVDGIVVSGDLTKAEGVPLEVGQTLFEIAPLDSMIAEVSVPEDDVRFVETGQHLKIRFDAFPYDSFETKVQRVRPRSESRDEANVFVATGDIQNRVERLRPGMEGTARIATMMRPLGWILLHKPVAAAWSWLGL